MTISITNAEAMVAREALLVLGDRALPIKAAYRVAILKRKIAPMLEAVEDVRKQLTETHGKRDEEGKLVQRTEERGGKMMHVTELTDAEAFTKAFNELLAQPTTLDALPLSLDLFGTTDVLLEPDLLANLGPLCAESPTP